ncbi:Uncharacterised protein [uncultured archaeon]|nr:Uncharacterised protein [uncultured archaeon]
MPPGSRPSSTTRKLSDEIRSPTFPVSEERPFCTLSADRDESRVPSSSSAKARGLRSTSKVPLSAFDPPRDDRAIWAAAFPTSSREVRRLREFWNSLPVATSDPLAMVSREADMSVEVSSRSMPCVFITKLVPQAQTTPPETGSAPPTSAQPCSMLLA